MPLHKDLTYHLESEERKGKHFLVVQVRGKGVRLSEALTKQFLLSAPDPQEKQALQFLVQEELKLSPAATTFTSLRVSSDKAREAVKLLSLTRKLYFGDGKLFFDPFSTLSFSYEASSAGDDHFEIKGKWKGGNSSGFLHDCLWLFPSEPPLVIKHGTLYAFNDEVDSKWHSLVFPKPLLVSQAQLQKWQAEWEDDPSWSPKLEWASAKSGATPAPIQPLPYLELTDRTGAFANLWMDYKDLGKFRFDDSTPTSWRQGQAEKNWENDLLETDFCKKIVDESHYYCPLDKVGKSLTFLLEIGWKIYDHMGRQVIRQNGKSVQVDLEGDLLVVKGRIVYGSHEADMANLLGAFNRREQFLTLDGNTVGLIDRAEVEEDFGPIAAEEVVSNRIVMKKNRLGLLGQLLEEAEVPKGSKIAEMILQLKEDPTITLSPPTERFHGNLFPYQQQGLDWLCYLKRLGFSGLLADDMGLGKTVQVLAFFSHLGFKRPTLIVAPTSLLFNWRKEIETFLPGARLYVHNGNERRESSEQIEPFEIILTSYALLRQDKGLFQSIHFETVVLDEGQNIKNPDSQIAQALFSLRSDMRLVLSGTPIENRWEDLWSLFHFLMPDLLGERKEFNAKMAAAASDPRYLQQTKKKTRPFLLRRKKQDVAIQLPEKVTQVVWVEMPESQRNLYEEWVKKNKLGLLKKIDLEGSSPHRMEILEAILRLRQICSHPWLVDGEIEGDPVTMSAKMERLMADVAEVVSEGRKVLIYSQFTQMLRLIQKEVSARFGKHVYLDGTTADRESIVRQFQEDPETQIFLISLKAGGVGLNLTAADYVFLYDPWWNEAAENQAIDRAHRVGRKDTVIARRYVTAMSIEEKLMRLKERKRSIAEGILDSHADMPSFSIEELIALLE
ncbi:MAG: DEAD/DEAH box helicase [Verrucomicrobia bacterium]|nr:DEAD/DEAH box helicase [Verrucomicrobiota bacterium]